VKTVLFLLLGSLTAWAQSETTPQVIFAGKEQLVRISLPEKDGDRAIRILQATAAILAPVGEPKTVTATRTVVETLPVTVPEVRAATRFVIEAGGVKTVVLAVPADALKGLSRLSEQDDRPLGVFDPDGKLRPALKQAGVEFVDFEAEARDCRLVIAWTKEAKTELPETVTSRVKRGTALVWVRPQRLPGVLATRWEAGHVVVVPPAPMETAAMQFNLVRYAELALTPNAWRATKEGKE
jgi:hypothetical protein